MTHDEFKAIREARGESEIQFARALGYKGSDKTVHRLMRRIERGEKEITPQTAIKAMALRHKATPA